LKWYSSTPNNMIDIKKSGTGSSVFWRKKTN
jgi:hypothetical protein